MQTAPKQVAIPNLSDLLESGELKIVTEFDDSLKAKLLEVTKNDASIDANTSDISSGSGRFANTENFAEWIKKERKVYMLVDKQGELLGIIWYGRETLTSDPTYNTTFAIRMYEKSRGKKLAKDFIQKTLSDFSAKYPLAKVWLSAVKENTVANNLYAQVFKKSIDISGRNIYLAN